jgi:hypothetical protein
MVEARRHACDGADLVVALGGPDRLAKALDGLELRARKRDPDAQALAGAVVDEGEDGSVSLVGEAPCEVDGPHPVGTVGDDGAVVDPGAKDCDKALMGKQSALVTRVG